MDVLLKGRAALISDGIYKVGCAIRVNRKKIVAPINYIESSVREMRNGALFSLFKF